MRVLLLFVCGAASLGRSQSLFPSGVVRFAGRDASRDTGDGGPAYFASLPNVLAFARDAAGNLYVAHGPRIRKIDGRGIVTTFADNLVSVNSLTVNAAGDIYFVGDRGRIQRLAANGVVSDIAGSHIADYNGEGVAALTAGMSPAGIALDAAGQVYFTDPLQRRVRTIRSDGNVYTIAGTGAQGSAGEGGPALQAQLFGPFDLAFDSAGNLLVADRSRIVKIDTRGTLTRVAGDPDVPAGINPAPSGAPALGTAISAFTLALDAQGNIYTVSPIASHVVKISPDGLLRTIAGAPFPGSTGFTEGCGDASKAVINVRSVRADPAGNVYILNSADFPRTRLQRIATDGKIVTIAGAGPNLYTGDGGPAAQATLDHPSGVAVDTSGRVFIADTGNNRVRVVELNGTIRTFAGDGGPTYDQDPACSADRDDFLRRPRGVAVDRAGNLYIADTGKDRIRKIAANGAQTTIATGIQAVAEVAVDASGKLYANDPANRRVVRVDENGVLTTVANIPATGAPAFDRQGRMLIPSGTVVVMVLPDGRLTRVAGTGEILSASPFEYFPILSHAETIDSAVAVTVDPAGSIYTADLSKHAIQRTTANCAIANYRTGLFDPAALATDAAGNLYIADTGAQTVWQAAPAKVPDGERPTPRLAVKRPVRSLAPSTAPPTAGLVQQVVVLDPEPIAPGELVEVTGSCIGPFEPAAASYDGGGTLPVTLAGTQIVIDGVPAPLISVSAGSIVAQVPLELEGRVHVAAPSMQVLYQDVEDRIGIAIQDINPALFTVNLGTAGPALALNEDGGVNSEGRPARKGSVIVLYGTGTGQTRPPGVSGQSAPANPLQQAKAEVKVTIGGVSAEVLAAASAPGFVGLTQINARVPAGSAGSGALPLRVTVGGVPLNQGELTVWIAP